ncbi:hypothetical protein A3860_22100 [Niastella vici]|uniref:Copper resistance protein D domain-containing protein n=1 Tax=Niastella vici TaxID=1703345 RepID=A0A1V9G0J1_9BACT|nr:DUF2214 family protein [Niastella vici]OQP64102.1 hypothetical protein A3860_22100 [Niastella vici]
MIPHSFYLFFLIIHLTAFALFTGTFFASIITGNQLWHYSQKDTAIMRAILITFDKYARVMGICLGLIVTMGILMMVNMHKVYGPQLWFRIKMGMVIAIIIFRILHARTFNQFKRRLNNEAMASFDDIKKRLSLFQTVQLVLIGGIIILSVCRFN